MVFGMASVFSSGVQPALLYSMRCARLRGQATSRLSKHFRVEFGRKGRFVTNYAVSSRRETKPDYSSYQNISPLQLCHQQSEQNDNYASPAHYVKVMQTNLQDELPKRREMMMQQLCGSAHSAQHVVYVQPSSFGRYRGPDVPYPFRQNSDFLYFSGYDSGVGVFVLSAPVADPATLTSHLFLEDRSTEDDVWHGPAPSEQFFRRTLHIDQMHSLSEFPSFLHAQLKTGVKRTIFFHDSAMFTGHPSESHWNDFLINDSRGRSASFEQSQLFSHTLRSRKSTAELAVLRYACAASALSMKQCMLASHAGMRESVLASLFELESRQRGLDGVAFPPVCASGENASTIHYISNKNYLTDGNSSANELLLMDAGGELFGYCADMSRVWPSSATHFGAVQHDLYRLVLCVQTRVIDYLRECLATNYKNGDQLPTIDDLNTFMLKTLGEACKGVGIAPKPYCAAKSRFYGAKELCPHGVGHHLGLDVHDCKSLSRWHRLEPGNVITIEPGIYIDESATFVPPEARGVGIRIEDVAYVGENGQLEILTQYCPKQIEEIETLLSSKVADNES